MSVQFSCCYKVPRFPDGAFHHQNILTLQTTIHIHNCSYIMYRHKQCVKAWGKRPQDKNICSGIPCKSFSYTKPQNPRTCLGDLFLSMNQLSKKMGINRQSIEISRGQGGPPTKKKPIKRTNLRELSVKTILLAPLERDAEGWGGGGVTVLFIYVLGRVYCSFYSYLTYIYTYFMSVLVNLYKHIHICTRYACRTQATQAFQPPFLIFT